LQMICSTGVPLKNGDLQICKLLDFQRAHGLSFSHASFLTIKWGENDLTQSLNMRHGSSYNHVVINHH
jgi:hypothetical protein